MSKVRLIIISLVIVVLLGGFGFLAIWEIPAPQQQIEKVLPDERFPK